MLIRNSWVAAILIIANPGVTADEPTETATDISTLKIHQIRAVDAGTVLGLIEPLLSDTRIALGQKRGQLIVFANPAIQKSIADVITKHEKTALLFERLDLKGADPQQVERVVTSGIRAASNDVKRPKADAFRIEFSRFARDVQVWGRASEIAFVKDAIAVLSKKKASTVEKPSQLRRTPQPPAEAEISTKSILDGGPILAPVGPIRLVPIKGADLLLIRGKRTDVQRVFGD